MTKELVTSDFKERVRNRIRDVWADIVTDEELDAIVGQTIDSFVHTQLPGIIRAQLNADFEERVKDYIRERVVSDQALEEFIGGIVVKKAPEILAAAMMQAFQHNSWAFGQVVSDALQSGGFNRY